MSDDRDLGVDRVRAIHTALSELSPRSITAVDGGDESGLTDATGVVQLASTAPVPDIPVTQALDGRRSYYDFGNLAPSTLSALLKWALGPQRNRTTPDGRDHVLTMHPTAGGLPSLTTHVVVLRDLAGIDSGIYLFDPLAHELVARRSGDVVGALAKCLVQPQFATCASAILVLSGELEVALARYSQRHYRTLHVDAGIAIQNLYLVATALGARCCAVSGFYDSDMARVLALGDSRIPLVACAVGGGQLGQTG